MSVRTGRHPAADRTLETLVDTERFEIFDALQDRMPGVWDAVRLNLEDESVVVVPSVSLAGTAPGTGTLMQAMEERALFLLLLLRQPRLRMIYVTSMPIPENVVDYYLTLLPGIIPSQARRRLELVAVGDASPRPLSAKLLERPRLLSAVRARIPNPAHSHLIPYNTTALERDVAIALGIPMYAADPRLEPLGTKTGARRIFEQLGVRCPAGIEDLHGLDDLVEAVLELRRRAPGIRDLVVKLNEGVSGAGNALVDVTGLPEPGATDERTVVTDRLLAMRLEAHGLPVATYLSQLETFGGIVEERITGARLLSPSVQMRVLPDRSVELLSTHDQLLGGPSGQQYLGCVFPADPAYSRAITPPAMAVGRHLASMGVLGRFAVDFVVVQSDDGSWTPYAIELNLRKGGTTHPFLTLQFLTEGDYDGAAGEYRTARGTRKHLVATDHLEDPRLRVLTFDDLFEVLVRLGLHFDQATQRGVVLHMLSCVTECGRTGLTAVGDTAEDAWRLYEEASRGIVDEAARIAAQGIPVA